MAKHAEKNHQQNDYELVVKILKGNIIILTFENRIEAYFQ